MLAVCEDRDGFELELARLAHERSLPTLGICRGMQVMNVALGGSLYRDLNNCGVTEKQHRQNPPYHERISHKVTIAKGSLLESVVSASGNFEVNSMHHQGVDHVAPALLVAARSEDRVVEAVEDPAKPFFLGVQWHPEYLDRHHGLFNASATQPTTATHGAHNFLPAKTFLFLVTKSSFGFPKQRFTYYPVRLDSL